jgi:DNA-binding transcriptional LysR family regulator
MRKIDHLALDGHALKTFLTVLDETSVSRAADSLGVTQSAVSHTLDKLRKVFGDPLFMRVGRGIEPTATALALRVPVESALEQLKSLTVQRSFDPLVEKMEFTIATNDFPLQLIFPTLLRELSREGVDLRIRFIPAGIPRASTLRASRYRMLITPTPPTDPDLMKVSLVQSTMVVFFDSKKRKPPKTWKQYIDSRYVDVKFSDTESSLMALPLADRSRLNPPTIAVPNFGSLAPMIAGTDRITTQLEVMSRGLLRELDCYPLPFQTKPLHLFLVWHSREEADPAHEWFRQRIIESMKSIMHDQK